MPSAEPVAIIVPTLKRPHLLAPLAENVDATTPPPYSLMFVVDRDDHESQVAVSKIPNAWMTVHDGTYPQKINAGVRATEEPILVLANDDVRFHDGWYEAAMGAFQNGVCVVGPDDLSPATEEKNHATMPIVRRSYIDGQGAAWKEIGVALHEGYHHVFSETELWQLAARRGVAKFVPECVIEHVHPDWGKAEMDDTYRKGAYKEGAWEHDERLFGKRLAGWENE